MRNTSCEPAEEPLALDDKHPTTLATRWIERPCQGPWCPGQSWDVLIGATGGALEARTLAINGEANFSPSELYICSAPCPEDTSQCEILALDPGGQPVQSTQTFEPGLVLHSPLWGLSAGVWTRIEHLPPTTFFHAPVDFEIVLAPAGLLHIRRPRNHARHVP